MIGKVVAYSKDARGGVILATNGQQYYFRRDDWISWDTRPDANLPVVFKPGVGQATDIRVANGQSVRLPLQGRGL